MKLWTECATGDLIPSTPVAYSVPRTRILPHYRPYSIPLPIRLLAPCEGYPLCDRGCPNFPDKLFAYPDGPAPSSLPFTSLAPAFPLPRRLPRPIPLSYPAIPPFPQVAFWIGPAEDAVTPEIRALFHHAGVHHYG